MPLIFLFGVFCSITLQVIASNSGDPCRTPNEESATCIPVTTCKIILDAIITRNPEAIEFARQSQCGYEKEALVCCGTVAYPREPVIEPPISPLLPNRTICGTAKADDRVFGGEITEIAEFPWMVLLKYKHTGDGSNAGFKCGGTVINDRYVLTAAHCLILNPNLGFEPDSVRMGEWRISTERDCEEGLVNEECADPVVEIKIQEMIVNRAYERRSGKHDIALLRLEKPIPYTNYIRPICLPAKQAPEPPAGTQLVVAGWGATENSSNSDYKLKVKLPLVAKSVCSAKVKQRGAITDEQVCAGGVSGKDSCQGDSGGPLMGSYAKNADEKNQWYQEGVVSWGVGCGIKGYPAIYTRVSMYVQWIADNLKE